MVTVKDFLNRYDVRELKSDEDYFEGAKIALAEKFQAESDLPLTAIDALDIAQDELLALIWG